MKNMVLLYIYYTDSEAVRSRFDDLRQCLDHINKEVIEKNEPVDDIEIHIEMCSR